MKSSDIYPLLENPATNFVNFTGDRSRMAQSEYERGQANVDLQKYPKFLEALRQGDLGKAQLVAAFAIFFHRNRQFGHRTINIVCEDPKMNSGERVSQFNDAEIGSRVVDWLRLTYSIVASQQGLQDSKPLTDCIANFPSRDQLAVDSGESTGCNLKNRAEDRGDQAADLDANQSMSGVAIRIGSTPNTSAANCYDFILLAQASSGHHESSQDREAFSAIYNKNVFRSDAIDRIVDSVHTILVNMMECRSESIGEIDMLSVSAARNIVENLSGPSFEMPETTVLDWISEQSSRDPQATAAVFGTEEIKYGELERRSNQLAHYIRNKGIEAQSPIAVCVTPSFDILIAILGIMKAGCIYVPLDPSFPAVRLATILDDVAAKLVVTQEGVRNVLPDQGFSYLQLDSRDQKLDQCSGEALQQDITLNDAAYIFYTSGTTGKPKGVVATHRNLSHYLLSAKRVYRFESSDIFCSLARYTFSISLFELMLPLICGARVRLLEREQILDPVQLTRTLQEVSVVHAGASLLRNLFRHLSKDPNSPAIVLPNLRHASSGGDLVPPDTIEGMKQFFPNAEIYVIYGCTEIACMGCTYFARRESQESASLVGKPFPNVAVRLLDENQQLVPYGVEGEICFSGLGLFREYLDRPELSREKTMTLDGQRFYKTGDLGRLDADGNIEILGRRDFQVQLRGIRVELGEIETAIREQKLATECLVTVKYLEDREPRLVAFVVNCSQADIAKFRYELGKRLPDYMLPQNLIPLDKMPLTPNGKLDRKKLHEMPLQPVAMEGYVAPTTDIELEIAQLFAESLNVERVGIDDIFFDLGGDSLLAVTVMYRLQDKFGLHFSPGLLFECPTVRMIAQRMENDEDLESKPILLGQESDAPSVFMLAGVNLYQHLARHLDGEFSVYGAFVAQELNMFQADDSDESVFDLAQAYVEMIRKHQPHGPYRLVGMSFGGIIAFEVAQQLRASGETIQFLGMIDAVMPRRGIWAKVEALSRLRHLPVQDALSVLGRRVQSRLSRKFKGLHSPEFLRERENSELVPLEERRQAIYRTAAGEYLDHARPFLGNVALVVSGERLELDPMADPQCGWSRLLPEVESITLGADHLGLVEEPSVKQIAELFRKKMQA